MKNICLSPLVQIWFAQEFTAAKITSDYSAVPVTPLNLIKQAEANIGLQVRRPYFGTRRERSASFAKPACFSGWFRKTENDIELAMTIFVFLTFISACLSLEATVATTL